MSNSNSMFGQGAKVVISPDQMRAWVILPAPARGAAYTPEAIAGWLGENGVQYGIDPAMLQAAAASTRYDELQEVARGKAPVAPLPGGYELRIENKPFTGLRGNSDGSLFYDDISFLQEVEAGQVLAEVTPPRPGEDGMTVTGEVLPAKAGGEAIVLEGSGFEVTDDGRCYRAPGPAHVSLVNGQLVVTPLQKLDKLTPEDGPVEFEGNVLVEGDVHTGAIIHATGSVFVVGRAAAAEITAGRNVLLCNGMRAQGGFGKVDAKENVWGLCFEQAEIYAGGDICANHLMGCEAQAGGRALILGGRGMIDGTTLRARGGVVCQVLGGGPGSSAEIEAGLDRATMDQFENMEKNLAKLNVDIQALQAGITAFERVNRQRPDKGRSDPRYKEMVAKRDQAIHVQGILDGERTRMKRNIDQLSAVSIIAREAAHPGVVIRIDGREMKVMRKYAKVKFKRVYEEIEAIGAAAGQ